MLSSGSDDWYVNGLAFINDSAPIIAVISSSALISAFPSIALITFFADLINVSCTSPKSGAKGGLNVHFMPLFATDS